MQYNEVYFILLPVRETKKFTLVAEPKGSSPQILKSILFHTTVCQFELLHTSTPIFSKIQSKVFLILP